MLALAAALGLAGALPVVAAEAPPKELRIVFIAYENPTQLMEDTRPVTAYLSTMPWQEQLKSYREIYRERRDAMLDELAARMPEGSRWTHPQGGLFVWATLPEGLDAKAMAPRALRERVAYVPGTGFYADGSGTANLRLNFSFSAPDRIREGIRRLATVVRDAPDAITVMDFEGRIQLCNPAAMRLYGWSEEEVATLHAKRLVPESRQEELERVLSRLKRGEPVESSSPAGCAGTAAKSRCG